VAPVRPTTISYGPGRGQVGDLWIPPQSTGELPLVILIHGGFWRSISTKSLMNKLARALVGKGLAVWNIEYRRLGPLSGGGGWPATFEDVGAAVDHVVSLPAIDTDRVVACGHSAGGALALWAAGRARLPDGAPGGPPKVAPCGAVSLAGILDLAAAESAGVGGGAVTGLLGADGAERAGRLALASPVAMLPLGVPQVLIHGQSDGVVPPEMTERYAASAKAAGDDALHLPLPGVGHRELIDPSGIAWDQTSAQLERLLGC
jgi:acetyl esterase/lipase